jgi:transcriptional regulator with XRE-family HTH domain
MGFRDNIRREIAGKFGGNVMLFAKKAGISNSYLNEILSGKRRFNETHIVKIAAALGVPEYYLFADEPLVSKVQAEKEPAIVEVFPDQETKIEYSKFRSRDDFVPIRILEDATSLGHGSIIAQERTRGYSLVYRQALPKQAVKQSRQAERVVALFADGDSMMPTIQGGSLIAIDIEDKAEIHNYKIYAVEIPDEGVTIKRVFKDEDHLILLADNRDFPGFPRAINLRGLNYNPVCGRVVWTWTKFS